MNNTSKAIVKRNMHIIGVMARTILFSVAFILKPGFRIDEFQEILVIVTPLTGLQLTLFVVYIIKNAYRYQKTVKKLSKLYIHSGYSMLILINAGEMVVLLLKALDSDNIPGDTVFFSCLFSAEILLALVTAVYQLHLRVAYDEQFRSMEARRR